MSNGPRFFETKMGVKFCEATMPSIAKSLEKIARHLDNENIVKQINTKDNENMMVDLGNITLKVYKNATDEKGLYVDVVVEGEEFPLILIEEKNKNVSIYLWEDKGNEDFTKKSIIKY